MTRKNCTACDDDGNPCTHCGHDLAHPDGIRGPSDEDVEFIENEVGFASGAWDMVPPKAIIKAAWSIAYHRGVNRV